MRNEGARYAPLVAAELRAALTGCVIGREIVVLRETKSTNDFLHQMVTPQIAEGIVVFAETQTAGRGQHGRHWESAPGKGLWFSILLRPALAVAESSRLTSWLAETISATIRARFDLPCRVEPPNDVYLAEKKLAGVLVEMRAVPERGYHAIAGVGINLNQGAEDFSAALRDVAGSIAQATGANHDRQAFALELLRNLDRTYRDNFSL